MNMIPYSNEYDAIPICRTHARTEPVRTPKFSSDNACDKIVACRTHALSLPLRSHPKVLISNAYLNLMFALFFSLLINVLFYADFKNAICFWRSHIVFEL